MLHARLRLQFMAAAHLPGLEPSIERGAAYAFDGQLEGVGEGGIRWLADRFAI
ncbi:hypothetical protein D3C74_501360 [compost metagenome]